MPCSSWVICKASRAIRRGRVRCCKNCGKAIRIPRRPASLSDACSRCARGFLTSGGVTVYGFLVAVVLSADCCSISSLSGPLAQPVEQQTFNLLVVRSNRTRPTIKSSAQPILASAFFSAVPEFVRTRRRRAIRAHVGRWCPRSGVVTRSLAAPVAHPHRWSGVGCSIPRWSVGTIKRQTVCHLVHLLYPPRHAGPTGTLLRKNYWLNHAAPLQPIDYNGFYLKKLM